MKILVLGGYGYFGSNLLAVLRHNPAHDLYIGARRQRDDRTVVIDWQSPEETLTRLLAYDVVVNAAPWPSDEYLFQCLSLFMERGRTWIETTADPLQTAKLLDWKSSVSPGPGAVMIGVGVFPGLTNVLVNSFSSTTGTLNLAIRYRLFSGAGPGMCRLMAETLTRPSVRLENGVRKEGAPVGQNALFPWSDGRHAAMQVYLADAEYLFRSTGIQQAATYLSVRPDVMNRLGFTANLLPDSGLVRRLLAAYFRFLRGIVFGKKRTPIEFCVSDGETNQVLTASDAFYAGSLLLEVCLEKVKNGLTPGFRAVDEVVTLEEVLEAGGRDGIAFQVKTYPH